MAVVIPEGGWRHNVGGFIACYRPRGWLVRGSTGPRGYVAGKIGDDGRPVKGSPTLKADTLDELAEKIDAAEGTMQ